MDNPWEQKILVGAKKQMSDPKNSITIYQLFLEGTVAKHYLTTVLDTEPLLKIVFNNGSLKEPLLNGYAAFCCYESLF
jgi:hypothetical protein